MSIDFLTRPAGEEKLTSPLLDLPIRLQDGQTATVQDLLDIFDTSRYADWMRTEQNLRFHANHGYNREAMLADLGPDVSPTGHHFTTLKHAVDIIERERKEGTLMGEIDDEELAIGLFAVGIHDLGECEHPELLLEDGVTRLVGDIPAGSKRPEDRKAETAVRRALYRKLFTHVDPRVIERVEAIIAHQDDTILHDLFENAHEATTLQTSVEAEAALSRYDHLADEATSELALRQTALESLIIRVRERARPIVRRTGYYSHVGDLMRATERPLMRHFVTPENTQYHSH